MDNNAKIVVEKHRDPTKSIDANENDAFILTAVVSLAEDVHWKNYVKFVLQPKLLHLKDQLEKETDLVKIYKIQGEVRALKEAMDLQKISKLYKAKLAKPDGKN